MIAVANNILDDNNQVIFENELFDVEKAVNCDTCLSGKIKHIFKVYEYFQPESYKKLVIYFVFVDLKNDNLSTRELITTVNSILNN
jgi:hypothetical protein